MAYAAHQFPSGRASIIIENLELQGYGCAFTTRYAHASETRGEATSHAGVSIASRSKPPRWEN